MKQCIVQIFGAAIALMFITGCGDSIAGKYKKRSSSLELTLSPNNAFQLSSGGTGIYSKNGSRISMSSPVCGTAKGEIKETKLVFPDAAGDDLVGLSFAGTWIKQ